VQQTSGNKTLEQNALRDAEAQINEIARLGKQKGPTIVDDVLKAVLSAKITPPSK